MQKIFISILSLMLVACSSNDSTDDTTTPTPTPTDDFIRAVDISFIPLIEREGTVYKYNSTAQNPLTTLKNAGCNTVRIRLWKNPTDNQSTFNEVKTLSTRAKNAGFKVWLTVHFSDTWADPAHQTP